MACGVVVAYSIDCVCDGVSCSAAAYSSVLRGRWRRGGRGGAEVAVVSGVVILACDAGPADEEVSAAVGG